MQQNYQESDEDNNQAQFVDLHKVQERQNKWKHMCRCTMGVFYEEGDKMYLPLAVIWLILKALIPCNLKRCIKK